MKKNQPKTMKEQQELFNGFLLSFGGGNFQCVFHDEVYEGISILFIRLLQEGYFRDETCILLEQAIQFFCKANCRLEAEQLSTDEEIDTVSKTVDDILSLVNQPLTYRNRTMAVEILWPYYLEPFVKRLERCQEKDPKINGQIRQYLIELFDIANKEISILDSIGTDLKKEFLKAVGITFVK